MSSEPDERTRRAWLVLARTFGTPEEIVANLRLASSLGRPHVSREAAVGQLLRDGWSALEIEAIFKEDIVPALDRRPMPIRYDDEALVRLIAGRTARHRPRLIRIMAWTFASPGAKALWRGLQGAIDASLHGAERRARVDRLLDVNAPAGRRNRARVALSELFLDAEVDDRAIAAIARKLGGLGFAIDELERMFDEEVAPVCDWGLSLLGPWAGFDEEWLVAAIERRIAHPPSAIARMLKPRFVTNAVRPLWVAVRAEMEREREAFTSAR